MKSLFSRFKGKRACILLLLAILSQTSASCASGGNDRPEPLLTIEQGKAGETENDNLKEADVMEVEGWTEIEFSDGDSASSVTGDIGFGYIAEWDGVKIEWTSSDESVITNEGKVKRQQVDKDVTMTANILQRGKKYQENFTLTVKRQNTIDVTTLEDYTLDQIDQMNKGDKDYEVEMNDFGYISHIDGTYSDIKVDSWDTALTSLYNIRSLLGIGDIAGELQLEHGYENMGTYNYRFNQIYKGLEVLGCSIGLTTYKNGRISGLRSSYFPIPKDMDVTPGITKEEAGKKAEQTGYGKFTPRDEEGGNWKLYIINDHGTGRLVWDIYCTKDSENILGTYEVVVDAKTGEVIHGESTAHLCH